MHSLCPLPTTIVFFLQPTSENEVINIFNLLKKNSEGPDGLKPQVLRVVNNVIACPLVHVINLSFSQGIVPTELKIARVCPIHKSGDNKLIQNYRPISVLSAFSKIFEKLVFNRLNQFLEKFKIITNSQFGFRSGYSTSLAISLLYEKITKAIEDKDHFVGIFLDLSKAFDTVNHEILVSKLNHYGIRGIANMWLHDYLSNRKQFVDFCGTQSKVEEINCGVPQGSVLGPLLFLIYINDLPLVSELLNTIIFADDTNLFITHEDIDVLQTTANEELVKVSEWLKVNKLSLNIKKSHAILFGKRAYNPESFSLFIDKTKINIVNETKFLGICIDKNLNWSNHIKLIACKIAKGIGIINKIKYKVNKSTLIKLYYSFIYPFLIYGNIIWGNAAKQHLNSIHILQKRVVRIICQAGYREHTESLFTELKILNIYHLHIYCVSLFMFKYDKGLLPESLNYLFSKKSGEARYPTRCNPTYTLPFCRTDVRKNSLFYIGASLFNSFVELCIEYSFEISSFSFFKIKLKKFIIDEKLCL